MTGPNPYEQYTARYATCEHPLVLDEARVPLADALAAIYDVATGSRLRTVEEVVEELIDIVEARRAGEHIDTVLELVDVEGTIVDGTFVHQCPYCFTDHAVPMDDHITRA